VAGHALKAGDVARKEMFKKSFLLCCIVLFALSAKASWSGNDDESYILGLRYPKSYDVKTYQGWPEVRDVKYKVRLLFPSKEVVKFYDDKLIAIGWVPFVQPNYPWSDRTWQKFVDCTIKGNPLVHQFIAYWVNKDHSRMVFLGIRYHSFYSNKQWNIYLREPKPNNDIQEIFLRVMPFDISPPPTDPAPKMM
jgi:hypothetical protein